MKDKKIAFIHYSHNPELSRLETMPFSLNAILLLANMGWKVDLYLWEKPCFNYKNLLPENVTVKYFKHIRRQFTLVRCTWLSFQFGWRKNYYCVFGIGQIAAHIASIISSSNQCPFIYFNDEFPSHWGTKSWQDFWFPLEQKAVKNAAMIVVPDPSRIHPLCRELDINPKSHAFLPNITMIKSSSEEIDWYERLGIAKDSILFLHAGYLGEQIPEILSSVPYWPAKAVIIIHSSSRNITAMEEYRKELSHLDLKSRVIWSNEFLSESDLNSLVSSVAGNFALYRNSLNNEYMGFASGKLMRSLVCGTPVIASKFSSLSFVKDYQLGVLVNHPCEIPAAIQEIIDNREAYSKRCLDFVQTEVSFEKYWQIFCDQLKEEISIDLRKPV